MLAQGRLGHLRDYRGTYRTVDNRTGGTQYFARVAQGVQRVIVTTGVENYVDMLLADEAKVT